MKIRRQKPIDITVTIVTVISHQMNILPVGEAQL